VADDVPLDPRIWPSLSARRSLRAVLALSMRSDVAADALVQRVRTVLDTSTEPSKPAQFGRWTGLAAAGPEAPWWLLRDGRRLALVSGVGAGDDLGRMAAGRFPSLGAVVAGDIERDVVQGRRQWLSVLVTTPRITRSLRRRGVPDHFVQMLGSVAAVAAVVRLTPDGIEFDAALRPAGEAPPKSAPGATP